MAMGAIVVVDTAVKKGFISACGALKKINSL